MKEMKSKALFTLLLAITIMFMFLLIAELKEIPKSDISKWEETEGYIVDKINGRQIVLYNAYGQDYYYTEYYVENETDIEKSNSVKVFYYKDNPSEHKEGFSNSYIIIIIALVFFNIWLVLYTFLLFKYTFMPKKGKKVKLRLVESVRGVKNGGTLDYSFVWQEGNKMMYLRDFERPAIYKEIMDSCGIKEIDGYIISEKLKLCYADFKETLEENNIIVSISKMTFDVK